MYPIIVTSIMTGACFAGAVYFACEAYLKRRVKDVIMSVLMMLTSFSATIFLFQRLTYG